MKQPIEPKKEDCCNSGCNPCIFDVYEKELKLYESYVKCGKNPKVIENAISQLEYSKFELINSIVICMEHKLLLFKYSASVSCKKVSWSPGEHFLFKYVSPEKSCTRAYTPMKIEFQFKEDYDFAIIVKRCGLVSNYLCDLNVGDNTFWRGPYGHFQLDSDKLRIVMVAQGTGIAPMYSIIKHILDDEDSMTKIILLYCCKCIKTILLRDDLYTFKSYWNFKYSIHISEDISDADRISYKYQEPIINQRLTSEHIMYLEPFTDKDLFLLCGSDEFIEYYKKWFEQKNITNIYSF